MSESIHCLSPQQVAELACEDLTPQRLTELENHLSTCRHCQQLLQTFGDGEDWEQHVRVAFGDSSESGLHSAFMRDGNPLDLGGSLRSICSLLGPTDDPRMMGRIGPYEIVGVLGSGGMGVVFKGFDSALNRYVAIKMLLPHLATTGAARQRFAREAQAAASVVNDHVMAIHCVAEWQGNPYLVMPYARGTSLQKRLSERGPFDLPEILRIGMQTAKGLAAAHSQGLVHRDVKPANILLEEGVDRVTLTDFGLARAVDDIGLTRHGMLAGTPQYMSPEQAQGQPVDCRSDLFSLGSVLYAMCTGRTPFRAESSYAVLRQVTDSEPLGIGEINPAIPDWFERIVMKLLAKSPASRFATATEVATLLEGCLAHVQQPTAMALPEVLSYSGREVTLTSTATSVSRALAGLLTGYLAAICCAIVLRSAALIISIPIVATVGILATVLIWRFCLIGFQHDNN